MKNNSQRGQQSKKRKGVKVLFNSKKSFILPIFLILLIGMGVWFIQALSISTVFPPSTPWITGGII